MTYEKHEQPQGLNDGKAGAQMQQPPEPPIQQMHEPSTQQLSEPREQAGQQAPEERRDGSMSIIAHLEELRKRLIYSIAAVAVGSGVAYFYIDEIMRCLTAPAGKLYYMQPAEAFFTYLKIAVFGGFLLALPIIFYEIWRFILPALTVRERKALLLIVPLSVVLFVVGIVFSFTLVLPAAIRFFIGFGTDNLEPLFSLGKYLDFVLAVIQPVWLNIEMPLNIVVIAKLGLVVSAFLLNHQRIVVFLSFVIGAVISPTPDVFSQTMIAVPMILLYEISYVIVRFVLRK